MSNSIRAGAFGEMTASYSVRLEWRLFGGLKKGMTRKVGKGQTGLDHSTEELASV